MTDAHPEDDLDSSTSSTKLLSAHSEPDLSRAAALKRSRLSLQIAIHLVLLSVSFAFFISGVLTRRSNQSISQTQRSFKHRFDGSFGSSSPYKGPPSAALDDAWDNASPLPVMRISEEVFKTLNASKHAVEVPKVGGRMALYEGFHMMHCVKSLWRATHQDYYLENDAYYREHREEWREHIDHCADMLRQKLTCEADQTILTYNWLKGHSRPHPNFNVQHTCKDWNWLIDSAEAIRMEHGSLPKKSDYVDGVVEFVEPPSDPNADA